MVRLELLFAMTVALSAAPAGADVAQSFDAQIPFAPVVADSAGASQLAYELHLTNFARQPIVIENISVVGSDGKTIAAASGNLLAGWLGRPGVNIVPGEVRTVPPGTRTIVYFNLPSSGPAPKALSHRVEYRIGGEPNLRKLEIAPATVDGRPPIRLSPPLRGGPWAAVYAPEMERGHRRVVYATAGAARIPGRFAIDWIRLDAQGRAAPEGARRLDAYHGHGAEVLAVADGVVASMRDDIPEAETLDAVPKVSIGDASGNYVALDLGGGRYAFYEHLQRGILVRPGQRVRHGEVIGRLGLTGQGSSPHLHFHVANADSLLAAEGLPFVIDGIEILGSYPSIDVFHRGAAWTPSAAGKSAKPITPGPNMVVRFPEQRR